MGSSISWVAVTTAHQTCTQKLLALPTLRQAKCHIGGVALLGLPTDTYRYGLGVWMAAFTSFFACLVVTNYVFLPVFFKLDILSIHEYLKIRFDNRTRLCASFMYILWTTLLIPILAYLPALVVSSSTGINLHVIAPTLFCICVFYTSIGGIISVIWTDTVQLVVTFVALVATLFIGLDTAGGVTSVYEKALEGDRLDIFNFDFDPTVRNTFWSTVLGTTVTWISITCVHQSCTQKFLAMPTLKQAKWASAGYGIGSLIIRSICCFSGLVIYKLYSDCDPLTSRQIRKPDEIVPYHVMDLAGRFPGLPGLYTAGILAGSLSVISASINSVIVSLYQDFLKKWLPNNMSEKKSTAILKSIVVVYGIITMALIFVAEHLDGAVPMAVAVCGITAGPLLGMFSLGILIPKANAKGAFYGGLCGVAFMAFVIFGRKYYELTGVLSYPRKPVYTTGCNFTINEKITARPKSQINPWPIFKVSLYYYDLMGTVVTMFVGILISLVTNKNEEPVDKDLISPICQFMIPKSSRQNIRYHDLLTAEKLTEGETSK